MSRNILVFDIMMLARDMVMTAIDFEGTGAVRGYADEPWQVGLVQIRGGMVSSAHLYEHLLHVGDRPFNRYAPGRHAELREKLKVAPELPSLWPELRHYLDGVPLVAHNAATEQRYLSGAFPLHICTIWIDTLKLSRLAYPGLPSYKLDDVLSSLGLVAQVGAVVPGREPHDALYDAVGCAVLLCHLLAQPGWQKVTLEDLVRLQKRKTASGKR
ncbi:MAG: exonuclease domain-containing protein [Kiritimatiellia bacterium]